MPLSQTKNSESAILARLVQPGKDGLSAGAARAILKLKFSQQDRDRMHELAVKNQGGALSRTERRELEGYLRIGRFLDLLCAKARLALKNRGRSA